MPRTKPWYISAEGGYLYLYKGNERLSRMECLGGKSAGDTDLDLGSILEAKAQSGCQDKVKFRFTRGEPRAKPLGSFSWEKSEVSRKFKSAKTTAEFMSVWEKKIAPYLDATTGAYKPPSSGGVTSLQITENSPSTSGSTSSRSSTSSKRKSIPEAIYPSKKPKTDGDAHKLKDMDDEIDSKFVGFFEIPITCIVEPPPTRLLREPDRRFIDSLKEEMESNRSPMVVSIVALLSLRDGEAFDDKHPNLYRYESIGGNNSRIALQELAKSDKGSALYKSRTVAVYAPMADHLALRLASRHNRATDFTHSLTTQDKVAISRHRYCMASDADFSLTEWRKCCAAILSQTVPRLDDAMIYYLAALPGDEYEILQSIFKKFEDCNIKDQKLSGSQRGVARNSKVDCKGSYFKCLRGLDDDTRKDLLLQVRDESLSFRELGTSARYIKKMGGIQAQFMRYQGEKTWHEAKEKYPVHTRKERLEPFIGLQFKGDSMPPAFTAFCKQARQWTIEHEESTVGTLANEITRIILSHRTEKTSAFVLKADVTTIGSNDFLKLLGEPAFPGFALSVVDVPQISSEWSVVDVQAVSRFVRSTNATAGITAFNLAVICSPDSQTFLPEVTTELAKDFTRVQVVYYHNSSTAPKDPPQMCLTMSVVPILLCHWTSTGDICCHAANSTFVGNLLSCAEDKAIAMDTRRPKQKPAALLDALTTLLTLPGQWVLDALSGAGTASVAAASSKRNTVAIDGSEECVGILQRRLFHLKEEIETNNDL